MANETAHLQNQSSEPSPRDRLDSWKEIASYLNCSERTVRRWEEEGLPIRRHPHKKKAAIYAFKSEIDAWWRDGHERLKQIEVSQEEVPAAVLWRRRTWLAGGGTLAALFVTVMWFNVGGLRERLVGRGQHLRIESLAVLPLENLSKDPEQEYFADGMTDQLITDVAQIPSVRVISRTSVMQYKKVRKPLDQIARELNVAAVVEGTVLRSGSRVRITAQLVQVKQEKHLWARSYEGDLRDVLALQDQVARDIAAEIRVRLTPEMQGRLSNPRIVDPEVYEDYLRGRYYWNLRTAEGVNRGIDYFRRAIAKDPYYALAYAGLADSYLVLAGYRVVSPNEVLPLAKAAASKALELDDSLAEAHAPLGALHIEYDLDPQGAEKEFRRAIELNPNYATAHHWYGEEVLAATGRFAEALAELKRAEELDPLSRAIGTTHGYVLYLLRENDAAIVQLHTTLEVDANFAVAHMYLGRVYAQKKMFASAIEEFQKAVDLSGSEPYYRAWLAYGYAVSGHTEQARRVLSNLQRLAKSRYVPPYDVAAIWMGLGEKERALKWLELAYEDHAAYIPAINVEPVFEGLRSEARFQKLVRRLNLPVDSTDPNTRHR
jgi:TolB-like protein/Flp pilus assembly protein TadD